MAAKDFVQGESLLRRDLALKLLRCARSDATRDGLQLDAAGRGHAVLISVFQRNKFARNVRLDFSAPQ